MLRNLRDTSNFQYLIVQEKKVACVLEKESFSRDFRDPRRVPTERIDLQ